jgi:signal transduction histidine kinase
LARGEDITMPTPPSDFPAAFHGTAPPPSGAFPSAAALFDCPLAHAVSAAGVGLWEIDLATGQEWWNDITLAMYGLPAGSTAPTRQQWREHFVAAEDLPRLLKLAEAFIAGAPHYEAEYRIRRADDGRQRWLVSRSAFKFGDKGRVLGITLDVTERVVAERRAHEAELQLGHAARQVGFGIGWRDSSGEGSEWSAELKRLWGLPATAATPSRAELVHRLVPSERERVTRQLATPIGPGEVMEFSFDITRADDQQRRTLTTRAFTEHDSQARPGRTFFVVSDNTELLARERQVAELLEQSQMAAEAAGMGTWERDFQTGQARWSAETALLLGLPADAAMVSIDAHLEFIHPDDRARARQSWMAADSGRAPLDFEYRIVRRDGTVRWVRMRGRVERDATGRPLRRRGVVFDITERREAEALARQRELAEEASAAKTEFLSRMSHELRTPLNAVLGFAQLMNLDSADPLSQAQRERLAHVQAAGWHLLALVNDVLDLSRIEARQAPMQPESVSLDAAVRECMAMVAPQADAASVAVQWSGSGSTLMVWADATRLRQLLINLLANGIKYNRRGGWVQVEATAGHNAQVVLTVRDNGLGIAAARLPQLFQPFNRAGREASGIEGTGLGLALVKLLVEQMGGRVEVQSREGEGSEFQLVLPSAAPLGGRADAIG